MAQILKMSAASQRAAVAQGPLPRMPPSHLLKKQNKNKQKPASPGPLDWEAAFEENQSLQEALWGFHVIPLLHLGVQGGDKKGR